MDPFLGQIILFAGNFAPRSWALCKHTNRGIWWRCQQHRGRQHGARYTCRRQSNIYEHTNWRPSQRLYQRCGQSGILKYVTSHRSQLYNLSRRGFPFSKL